jgi:condensin complex subunit 2
MYSSLMKQTTHRSEATLAKSFDTLKIKKFDLEFSVDPLFKKTKEDFDEGGAMGLLLNHLGVDGKGRLVFDAGDVTVGDEDDEMDPADEDMVDLASLRSEFTAVEQVEERLMTRVYTVHEEDSSAQHL